MKNILIGGAWPYANGSLHIGHVAALLPGDVLARYYRAKGDRVFYVSGSDCHGTPITIRARQEGRTPREISEDYHREFCDVFEALGFSYDLYTKTSAPEHVKFVQAFHRRLYESALVEERTVRQAFCPRCRKVLTDRMVIGRCPACGEDARGDQCDACGEVLEADQLLDARCAECGTAIEFGQTKQLFLSVSRLEPELRALLEGHPNWRRNARAFTRRYLDEGLRDRAITRDLDWGIEVPRVGYEDKRIYIWAENVLGYLSAGAALCEARGVGFAELFGENARHYYVHGKDNIPFHTIILPALLLAHGGALRLPDDIVSSEHVTLEGRKISTSRNWAIWAKDLARAHHPDAIRYFFIANGPEKRDADFSFREFVERNNADLVGIWGNFVHRTLAFIEKYLGGRIPAGTLRAEVARQIEGAFAQVGAQIEAGRFREALEQAFALARFGNRFYDAGKPWIARREDPQACADVLFNCVQLIASLSALLAPFLPFSSKQVADWMGASAEWRPQTVPAGRALPPVRILFERIAAPEGDGLRSAHLDLSEQSPCAGAGLPL